MGANCARRHGQQVNLRKFLSGLWDFFVLFFFRRVFRLRSFIGRTVVINSRSGYRRRRSGLKSIRP